MAFRQICDKKNYRGMCADQAQVIKVARRVYVGNLSWTTTWHSLKDHFKNVSILLDAVQERYRLAGNQAPCIDYRLGSELPAR